MGCFEKFGHEGVDVVRRSLISEQNLTNSSEIRGNVEKITWGVKVSDAFKRKVIVISQGLGVSPDFLMACMAFETGETFSPAIKNAAGSGAVGLIQFMPSTAKCSAHLQKH
jgi:membrane-bound lytic murein transglycosylase B